MKVILLVGGLGTRLRPLTNRIAKPMVPLVNRPFLEYTLDLLKRHGLREIIFSSFYLPEAIEDYFGDGARFGVSIEYCLEAKPLGTAGAIKNCEPFLDGDTFMIFNGDILTDLDITDFLAYHRRNGALATISLGKVIDPTAYGMIDVHPDGRVSRWLEKPTWDEVTSRYVNIGASIFEPDVLRYIPANEQVSIERQTYPMLIERGLPIFGYQSIAYWLDIGTPDKYSKAQRNLLQGVIETDIGGDVVRPGFWLGSGALVDPTASIKGAVVIGRNARIGAGTIVVGPTVIGDGVIIGADSFIEESTIWNDCVLKDRASIVGTILGRGVTLEPDATLKEGCIVEDGYIVYADRVYDKNSILSHAIGD